ncbi:MAG: HD domain-containing protein [Weeksellaceae bacterium]|nr:HD domain-containing protein [Weeksellaceae bacterium]
MNHRIEKTVLFVKEKLKDAEAGHDWFHIERVWNLAKKIAEIESCNREVVELAALLHDIADPKFHDGNEELALTISGEHLVSIGAEADIIQQVLFIIKHMSFKNSLETGPASALMTTGSRTPLTELHIVQDADRLDAIGAIGIARTFNFGGYKNNLMYDPEIKPKLNMTKAEYKKNDGTTINHFYEKLLLLKDRMNTVTAKKIASRRHDFMLKFLEEFYNEWNSNDTSC